MIWSDPLARRSLLLWLCTLLFLLRVVGQIEALLIAPAWLPEMKAWHSGLLPYAALLPAQILILMLMCALNVRAAGRINALQRVRVRTWVGNFALVYFAAMLVRLVVALLCGAQDLIAAGGIPVAFHCVLALYLRVLARDYAAPISRRPNSRSISSSSLGSTGLVM